jgi:hypothetical protein
MSSFVSNFSTTFFLAWTTEIETMNAQGPTNATLVGNEEGRKVTVINFKEADSDDFWITESHNLQNLLQKYLDEN